MILVDATTLIALGRLDRLALLTAFDGRLSIPPAVHGEIKTDPESTAVELFLDSADAAVLDAPDDVATRRAQQFLGEVGQTGDVQLLAYAMQSDEPVAVVSDDRAVRSAAQGMGADITGTLGVVVRAAASGMVTRTKAHDVVSALDNDGLHMTAALQRRVREQINEHTET